MRTLILVLFTVGLLFGFLLVSSPAFGYTASKFVADYGYELSDGQKIKVLVKVKGEPESEDPVKRAKEIRFLQSAVLKFCNFAGATNVKTDIWNNEFTAIVTTSLAQILEQRSDVISVQVLETLSTSQPESPSRNMIYDLVPNVDVEIMDLKIIPMDDKPKDPFDDSDVIVIKFEITNRGIDYFVLSDKMFRILVLDPSFPVGEGKPESSYIVDNYFTLYDVELETRYDDYPNLEIFEDCEYLHDRISVNQTETFSICFDVLRIWDNEILNIDGPKHYFLALMDNIQYNSCPNCIDNLLSIEMMSSDDKKILLPPKLQEILNENDIAKLPFWIQKTIEWHSQGKISETELINAIKYLEAKSSFVEITDKCYREKFPIDWSGCNLYGKVLPNIDYRYANLSNANLKGAIFSGKDLSNANLSGAFLKYAEIDNANLTNADLSNVNIVRGWVRGSDLSNVNLSDAYLWNTDFSYSNLTNVNFQDATLTYAILAGTDLKDANFDGAGTWSTNLNDCYNHPICE